MTDFDLFAVIKYVDRTICSLPKAVLVDLQLIRAEHLPNTLIIGDPVSAKIPRLIGSKRQRLPGFRRFTSRLCRDLRIIGIPLLGFVIGRNEIES